MARAACSRAAASLRSRSTAGDEGGHDGEPLAGAGVHAGLGPGFLLLVLDVAGADGAGDGPLAPPGGVVQRPLGEVEVEAPDGHQGVAGRLAGDGLLPAAGRADGPCLDALLPGGGDVGGQVQGADAGVVGLQVLPEPLAQRDGHAHQGAVVDAGLPLEQVVHEEVPDRAAGQVVAVDHLLGGELSGEPAAEHPDRGRGTGREGPGCGQELVEERAERVGLGPGGEHGLAAAQQLDAVAGGDGGDGAALGGHHHRDPLQRQVEGLPPGRADLPQRGQGRHPGRVADPAHLVGEADRRRRRQQPGQAGADHVAADQLRHARAEPDVQARVQRAEPAGVVQATHDAVSPVAGSDGLGAGGVPPLLPCLPGVQLQPVQELQDAQLARVPGAGAAEGERRGQYPPRHREPVCGRLRPGFRDRARREPFQHRQRLGAELPRPGSRPRGRRGGHQRAFPNITSRLSAR